jgi:plastocyanin
MTFPAVLAALALVLAACGAAADASPSAAESEPPESEAAATEAAMTEPAESEEAGAAEERVRLESSVFDPRELTIQVGTIVIFTNVDSFEHTVTEGTNGEAVDDPIVDERIEQNQTVRVTFDEPGTYEITCEVHPSMQMTITVEG